MSSVALHSEHRRSGSISTTQISSLIDEYELDFESVMNNAELRAVFSQFLEKLHVEESLHFVTACDAFTAAVAAGKNSDELLSMAQDIYKRFIREDALEACNLPGEVRRKIAKELTQPLQDTDWTKLFHSARFVVMMSLAHDNFTRFVRSDLWRDWIEKQLRNASTKSHASFLLQQCGHLRTERDKTRYVYYSKDDLYANRVLKKDLQFARAMMEDDTGLWTMAHSSADGRMQTFRSDRQFVIDESMHSKWYFAKVVMYIDANWLEFLQAYGDSCSTLKATGALDWRQVGFKHAESPDDKESLACTITNATTKMPPPFTNRQMSLASTVMYDADQQCAMLLHRPYRPASPDDPQPVPLIHGCVHADMFFTTKCQFVGENLTRVVHVMYYSAGAQMLPQLVNRVVPVYYSQKWHKGAKKAIDNFRQWRTSGVSDDVIGFLATARDWCERFLPRDKWPSFLLPMEGKEPMPDRSQPPFGIEEVVKYKKGGRPVLK